MRISDWSSDVCSSDLVDGEAALDPAKDDAFDARFLVAFLFETVPGGFAAGAVAGQHRFAIGVLDAVDIDFDFVTDLLVGLLVRRRELAQRHAPFALQHDVRTAEHTSELQSILRLFYAVFCLKEHNDT